jgi:hypothetical protein
MTQEDKLKLIAEYDGWLTIPEGTYNECHRQTTWFGHGGNYGCYHDITALSNLKYLTSLDWLHPVTMKVIDELWTIKPAQEEVGSPIYYRHATLRQRCSNAPVNGEYIDLFNSVVEAIEFLNKVKQQQCIA